MDQPSDNLQDVNKRVISKLRIYYTHDVFYGTYTIMVYAIPYERKKKQYPQQIQILKFAIYARIMLAISPENIRNLGIV